MERRKVELQIRAVLVTYRIEVRRRDARTMEDFRVRARAMLGGLDDAVRPYPDLAERLRDAHHELEVDPGKLPKLAVPPHSEGRPRSPGG